MALHCSGPAPAPLPRYLAPDPILSDLTENLGPFQSLYAMKPMFNPSVQGPATAYWGSGLAGVASVLIGSHSPWASSGQATVATTAPGRARAL